MDQPKVSRMLRLMKMMSGNISYTVDQLSEHLDMSQRTIYRYIDTFKQAGFVDRRSNAAHVQSLTEAGSPAKFRVCCRIKIQRNVCI